MIHMQTLDLINPGRSAACQNRCTGGALLNQAGFKKIRIFHPHSEVSTALIDRSYAVTNHQFVQDALQDYTAGHPGEAVCLVSPDAGALKKIHKLAQFLQVERVVECMKERDVKTGALTNFKAMTSAGDLPLMPLMRYTPPTHTDRWMGSIVFLSVNISEVRT
jgi:phosphoribosylpyrophosphate synthetase